MTGSVTSFWLAAGRHQTKGGYEFFRSQLTGGGSQSATSYVFSADFLTTAAGDSGARFDGRLIPVFVPGQSFLDFYPAIKGATLNVNNNSLYVQDHWTMNGRWSADLGARYENVRAISTGDIVSVSTNRIVPRLAVGYDRPGEWPAGGAPARTRSTPAGTTKRKLAPTARSGTPPISRRSIGDRPARVSISRPGSM